MLILFGGLPAVGKTTLAQEVARVRKATYLRIDTIEHEVRTHGLIEEHTDATAVARLAARTIASDNLRIGQLVVVDAFNGRDDMRRAWRDAAEGCSCSILEVHVTCSDRVSHKSRADARQIEHDGRKPVSWEQIADMQIDPWPEARLVIDTAGKTCAAAAAEVLSLLSAEKVA